MPARKVMHTEALPDTLPEVAPPPPPPAPPVLEADTTDRSYLFGKLDSMIERLDAMKRRQNAMTTSARWRATSDLGTVEFLFENVANREALYDTIRSLMEDGWEPNIAPDRPAQVDLNRANKVKPDYVPMCPEHQGFMLPSKFEDGGFYCGRKDPDGKWCSYVAEADGKVYKRERRK